MFPRRYFAGRYYPPRYFPEGGNTPPPSGSGVMLGTMRTLTGVGRCWLLGVLVSFGVVA